MKLRSIPAFGYEFSSCKFEGDVSNEIGKILIRGIPVHCEEAEPYNYRGNNLLKVLGYFPVFCIYSGITRMEDHSVCQIRIQGEEDFKKIPNSGWHMFRGITEALGLGFLFILVDLVVTIWRLNQSLFMDKELVVSTHHQIEEA